MDHRVQASASQILLEAIQDCEDRKVSKVMVLCFNQQGEPLGYLSNEAHPLARIGMVEAMKLLMLSDDLENGSDLPHTTAQA